MNAVPGLVRRYRLGMLVVLAVVVAVALAAWAGRGKEAYPGALDPRNPDGTGAQAVAQVLRHQGVHVEVARSQSAFDHTRPDASTTVVVTSTDHLGPSTTARLLSHLGGAHQVVVGPNAGLVTFLGGPAAATTQPSGPVPAGCAAYAGLSLRVDIADAYPGRGCFRRPEGAILAAPTPGLTLVGSPAILTNDQILRGDNAAIALRLLGGRPRLVWYVPSLADLSGSDAVSVGSLLPRWLGPGIWLVLVTAVAVVCWRARRLGPLAREPLPVEVKAVETTRNLGRLYRRSGDRAHAAATLRSATRRRLSERLRLPRGVPPAGLVDAVARRAGRRPDEVEELLGPGAVPPQDDRELVSLASRLTELDREVSR